METQAPTLAQLRKRPHWSCSSISTFMVCSLAWAFRYVYRLEPGTTPAALVFGGCFHKALGFLFRKKSSGEAVQLSVVLDLFSDLLLQENNIAEPAILYDEGEDVNSFTDRGRQMLEAYVTGLDPEERVLAVDVPFCVPLEDGDGNRLSRPLIGEYDAVVVGEKDTEVIIDWKTSRARYAELYVINHLQPTCYLYAHKMMGGHENTRFRFDVVTKTKTPTIQTCLTRRDPGSFLRLVELVRTIEKAVRHECFIPNEQSWRCRGCEYGLTCQAWHKERHRSLHNFQLAA